MGNNCCSGEAYDNRIEKFLKQFKNQNHYHSYAHIKMSNNLRRLIGGIESVLRCVLEEVNVLFPASSIEGQKDTHREILDEMLSVIRRQDSTLDSYSQLECVRVAVMHIIIKYHRGGSAAFMAKSKSSNYLATTQSASAGPSNSTTAVTKESSQKQPGGGGVEGDLDENESDAMATAATSATPTSNRFTTTAEKNAALRLAVLNFRRRYSMGPAASNKFQEKLSLGMNNNAIFKHVSFQGAIKAVQASNKMLKKLRAKQVLTPNNGNKQNFSPKDFIDEDAIAVDTDDDDIEAGGGVRANHSSNAASRSNMTMSLQQSVSSMAHNAAEAFAADRSNPLAMVVALLAMLSSRTGIPYEEMYLFQIAMNDHYSALNNQQQQEQQEQLAGSNNGTYRTGGAADQPLSLEVELLKLSSPTEGSAGGFLDGGGGGGLKTFNDFKGISYPRRLEIALKQPMAAINHNKNFAMLVRHQCDPNAAMATALQTYHNNNNAAKHNNQAARSAALRGKSATNVVRAKDLGHLLHMWYEADSDCSGNITEAELKTLLGKINISVSVMTAEKLLDGDRRDGADGSTRGGDSAAANAAHQQIIDFRQFFGIYRRLTTVRDIKALFLKYATPLDKLELYEIEEREVRSNNNNDSNISSVESSMMAGSSYVVRVSVRRKAVGAEVSAASMRQMNARGGGGSGGEANMPTPFVDAADEKMRQVIEKDPDNEEYYSLLREDCKNFLMFEQFETEEDAVALLPSFGFSADVEGINLRQFQQTLLNCCLNSWLHPRELTIHHDMTQPMTHYFINSSHNTYLCGHQLTGKSSTDMYALSLLNGNRCVELDCYDGSDNTPEVTHGNTLTTRIKFRDVCQTINDCGFATSPYPITLSLEVHTSITQQEEMVRIMAEIFGPKLTDYNLAYNTTLNSPLFTPEGLRGKIIVKSKRRKDRKKDGGKNGANNANANTNDSDNEEGGGGQGHQQKGDGLESNLASISEKLSDQTFMPAVKFKSLEALAALPHYGVSSVDEAKVEGWYRDRKQQLQAVNVAKGFMVRVYPSGTRMDSSNLDPQISWNIGAQMSAMNIQTQDRGNRLNFYKFRYANNNCGYLLKPKTQRIEDKEANNNTYNDDLILAVTVMFGFSLPRPDHLKSGDIADPFVELFVRGFGNDDSLTSNGISGTGPGGGGEIGKTKGANMAAIMKSESVSLATATEKSFGLFGGGGNGETESEKEREGGRNNSAAKNGSLLRLVSEPEVFKLYKNQVHATRTINDNGFKPSWSSDEADDKHWQAQHSRIGHSAIDFRSEMQSRLRSRREGETFYFAIRAVELATLCIRVLDRDVVGAGLMGETAIPLSSIREGYRQVPLFDKDGREIPSPACLFLKIQWENPLFVDAKSPQQREIEKSNQSSSASFRFVQSLTTGPKNRAPVDREQRIRRDFNTYHHLMNSFDQTQPSTGAQPSITSRHFDANNPMTMQIQSPPPMARDVEGRDVPLALRHSESVTSPLSSRGASTQNPPAVMLQSQSPTRSIIRSSQSPSSAAFPANGVGGSCQVVSSPITGAANSGRRVVQFQREAQGRGVVLLDDDDDSDDHGMIDPSLL